VDPETFQVTDCHFDYGLTTAYGSSAPCSPSPGSGSGDVAVHADLSGLSGGTTYHFRVVASNAQPGGTASRSPQTFTTTGPGTSPTAADHITDTSADLHAAVNPEGQATTYQFQYVTDAGFQATGFSGAQVAPADPVDIGNGSVDVPVTEHLG